MNIHIAIDGPAASGKSTVAKLLASKLNGLYVNTGEMYRTIAAAAFKRNIDPSANPQEIVKLLPEWTLEYRFIEEKGILELFFNGEPVDRAFLRSKEVNDIVSQTACIPAVRDWMFQKQRDCMKFPIIIMEGRDIATVILPNTPYKFFVTASAKVRAERRIKQGEFPGMTLEQAIDAIERRDHIDSTRPVAPLKPAPDSIIVNTDDMTPDEVADYIIATIKKMQQ